MVDQHGPWSAAERHERMSVVDTAWLRMDAPGNPMTIVSVLTTATRVRLADLRHVVATRLLCFPRFRRRPVADALGASWHEPAFLDVNAHVVAARLPAPAGRAELQALAARLATEPLDPARPLWQIHLVERYGAGSAWVLRVHHCYADGIAMVRVLLSLTEQDSGPALAGAHEAATRRPARSDAASRFAALKPLTAWLDQVSRPAADIVESALAEGARLLESGVHTLFHPDTATRFASQAGGVATEFTKVLALPDDPPTPLRGPLSGTKRIAWSAPLELAEVRKVAHELECTVNDALLACVAGAIGKHLRTVHGLDTTGLVLRASVPINLRAAEEPLTLGNKFGLLFVELPVGVRDPRERVARLHDVMHELKGSLQPPMTLLTLGVLGVLPAGLQASAIEMFSRKGTFVVSNVPGPQAPLNLCGQRVDEMYFWVPQSGTIGIGISLLSYAGNVHFGVISDEALLPEPQVLADEFHAQFVALCEAPAAKKPTRGARKPAATRPRGPRQTKPPAAST